MNLKNLPDWLAPPGADLAQAVIGTKAKNLAMLERMGFSVPSCLFVTTLGSERAPFESAGAYLAAVDDFSLRLSETLPSENGWAVRSSATIEDMPGESHAGRFETLFISEAAELANAVKVVWDSAESAGIGPESMGVVVQQLVDADFAGVAFSNDPTQNDNTTVIEGVPGNAARFVDGEVTPWRVRPGTEDIVLPDGLSTDIVAALDEGVQRLAAQLDMAVDTEWAVSDGHIYWLQVRPLTGAQATEFKIPESQKTELKGLWVRINHSFAPQATLVASMNPGGYFNGSGWTSCLVNNFHYIQEEKRARDSVAEGDFDRVLDEWDEWERRFEPLLDERQKVTLSEITGPELWQEALLRVELSQQYFRNYSDRRFLEIRDRSEQRVNELIADALGDDRSPGTVTGQLLGQLGSLTEEKQRQLRNLAKIFAADRTQEIQETPEWRTFMDQFGSESPTTHLFYLPTLQESPELVAEMINQIGRAGFDDPRAEDWRATAASIVENLPEGKHSLFATEIARLRRCLLRTEDDDYALSKCTKLVRDVYLEAGRMLVSGGVLEHCDDVFHLTGAELSDALAGKIAAATASVVRERRRDFEQCRLLSPPPMIMNGRAMMPKAQKPATMLTGTPASPGVASGIVLVLNDPFSCVAKQLPDNAVIVAPIVTPALAYSLIGCAAVVTEIGGLASHGAIVAREMAIPAVVGVGKARAILQTGMSVTVDGSQGEISILGSQQ